VSLDVREAVVERGRNSWGGEPDDQGSRFNDCVKIPMGGILMRAGMARLLRS
jgi:hypothetical protein